MREHSRYPYRAAQPAHLRKPVATLSLAPFITALYGTWVRAQSSSAQSFDVISVKPNRSVNSGSSYGDGLSGTFTARNLSLLVLVEYSYDVKEGQIEGLPTWADSEKYDIDAKIDDGAAAQEKLLSRDERAKLTRTRVQSLLADRFGLTLHHETKDLPVLELTIAKGGAKLSETAATPAPGDAHPLLPGSIVITAPGTERSIRSNQVPLAMLINFLSGVPEVSGRVLLDQTGLTGKYTFELKWAPQHLSDAASSSDTIGPEPSLFTALQEQLGLRLESTKAPVDVLVIDHVERPSPN